MSAGALQQREASEVCAHGRMTLDELPLAVIEFRLGGWPGRVLVRYGVDEDPARWGYLLC
jgi:hypothetical protein